MRAFELVGGDRLRTELEPLEAALLTQLAGQVAEVLTESTDDDSRHPAVRRLLPDAYRDDRGAASEFRRFTADELSGLKVRNAQQVIADVAEALVAEGETEVVLDDAAVQAWVRSLTDIRLVLASRLGIERDGHAGDDEAFMLADVYDWLGWVQDSLVTAMDDAS